MNNQPGGNQTYNIFGGETNAPDDRFAGRTNNTKKTAAEITGKPGVGVVEETKEEDASATTP